MQSRFFVIAETAPHPFLRGMIVGKAKRHQLVEGHVAFSVERYQYGTGCAKPQALLHRPRGKAETCADFLGCHALPMQGRKCLVLIGGMHGGLGDILGQ